jgi:hypothetical protein
MKRRTEPGPGISGTLTKEDYKRYWKKAREKTSSSYSGTHFGHYISAVDDDYLAETHALLIELAYSTGFSLPRWQVGLSAMLEKEKGVIRVDKLRAILLMEADFNFANKTIHGHRMMAHAEATGQIPEECFGSRNGHDAQELGTTRRHAIDLSRQRHWPMAVASVDAHTCYDRIVHSVASLCCQRLDVDRPPIVSMLSTIQKMKFHLRTGFGDSTTHYGGNEDGVPFQGVCQGNGAGPALWLAVSIVLVSVMHQQGHVNTLRSAITAATVVFAGFLFVDDTDLVQFSADAYTTPAMITAQMQDGVAMWQGALRATGGSLKPEKCSWCLVAYRWDQGKWSFHSQESLPASICICSPAGELVDLTRLEPNEPITVVGMVQAMDGAMTGQVSELQGRADVWGAAILNGWVPRHLAWHAVHSSIWPSLRYPLVACNLTAKEGKSILTGFYKRTLPKMGICRYIPIAFRHAPLSLQGLALPDPFVEQGIAQIRYLLTYGNLPNMAGHLLRASFEQAQIELGTGTPFLESSFTSFGGLLSPNLWVGSLWNFVHSHGITLRSEDYSQSLPTLQRIGDYFLMDRLIALQCFSKSQLQAFNRCRLYMQALTLADICTGDGTRVQSNCFACIPRHDLTSRWIWPTEQPSNRDQDIWQQGLQYLTGNNLSLNSAESLGSWIATPHKDTEWYLHCSTRRLYRRHLGDWWFYSPHHDRPLRRGVNFSLCERFTHTSTTVRP